MNIESHIRFIYLLTGFQVLQKPIAQYLSNTSSIQTATVGSRHLSLTTTRSVDPLLRSFPSPQLTDKSQSHNLN
jgi:hypothetical protein